MRLGGATVLRGPMGFGKSSRMHTAKILRLSMDLPLVSEIVDSEEKINAFLPVLDGMLDGGLYPFSGWLSCEGVSAMLKPAPGVLGRDGLEPLADGRLQRLARARLHPA
jgi:hypothetical protein